MDVSGLLLAGVLALWLLLWLLRTSKDRPHNFPPGPPRLPIWGSLPFVMLENFKFPYKVLDAMTYRYGSRVLGIFFGDIPVVVACDYDSVRQALNDPKIQGRVPTIVTQDRAGGKDLGVFFVDGPLWQEQRRFALRHMRDYGFGRRSHALEGEATCELTDLIEALRAGERPGLMRKRDGRAEALLPDALQFSQLNMLLPVICGARKPREYYAEGYKLCQNVLRFQMFSDSTGGATSLHPWLKYVAPGMSGYTDAIEGTQVLKDFMAERIEEHEKSSRWQDKGGCPTDFIESYLRELSFREGQPSTFSKEQLVMLMTDFMFPAATAMSTVLAWGLMFVAYHPEVMKKVQQEIDRVVGSGRLPTLDDRPNMPYTEATIRETLRYRTLTPISVLHRATEDTQLGKYDVPKDTAVITCLWSMHMDPKHWGDPQNFRPERFLDSSGKLNKKDFTLPFGAGKRLCAGETFARQNLFVTFSALMQNFTVGGDLPPLDCNRPGVIETPPPFWMTFTQRGS